MVVSLFLPTALTRQLCPCSKPPCSVTIVLCLGRLRALFPSHQSDCGLHTAELEAIISKCHDFRFAVFQHQRGPISFRVIKVLLHNQSSGLVFLPSYLSQHISKDEPHGPDSKFFKPVKLLQKECVSKLP